MQQLSEKQKKERKFVLILPILTLPFLCLGFWALGGGMEIPTEREIQQKGLNMTLPEAQIEPDALNKLESYERADKQASKVRELRRMDPFAGKSIEIKDTLFPTSYGSLEESTLQQTEDQVQGKLIELEKLLSQPDVQTVPGRQKLATPIKTSTKGNSSDDQDIQRLESLMATISGPEMEDPEMERIDSMLDKLLDVQHPQRVHERLSQHKAMEREAVFSVSLNRVGSVGKYSEKVDYPPLERNGFYSLGSDEVQSFDGIRPTISAQVNNDQEVVTGASIELELTQPIYINGVEFPSGTPVTGVCSLDGERLNIEVQNIRSGNLIVPVSLKAMDLDALPGIKIPNTISRDAVKQGAGDGIQSMNRMGMSSSWETQASMAGMETVKGILSTKAKLVKVTVKAGHPLLLMDQSGN